MVPPPRIELRITGYQPIVIPFNYRGINLAPRRGLEPLASGVTGMRASMNTLRPNSFADRTFTCNMLGTCYA